MIRHAYEALITRIARRQIDKAYCNGLLYAWRIVESMPYDKSIREISTNIDCRIAAGDAIRITGVEILAAYKEVRKKRKASL